MGFLLECPNCGKRDVYEFRFGGEAHKRPRVNSSSEEWMKYVYMRENVAGVQQEFQVSQAERPTLRLGKMSQLPDERGWGPKRQGMHRESQGGDEGQISELLAFTRA